MPAPWVPKLLRKTRSSTIHILFCCAHCNVALSNSCTVLRGVFPTFEEPSQGTAPCKRRGLRNAPAPLQGNCRLPLCAARPHIMSIQNYCFGLTSPMTHIHSLFCFFIFWMFVKQASLFTKVIAMYLEIRSVGTQPRCWAHVT